MLKNILAGAMALALVGPAFAAEPAAAPETAKSECCTKMQAEDKKCCCCDHKAEAKAPAGEHGKHGHEGHGNH